VSEVDKTGVNISLKQRIVGAMVLVSLAIIFVPMILDGEGVFEINQTDTFIPAEPKFNFGNNTDQKNRASISAISSRSVVDEKVSIVDEISEDALKLVMPDTQAEKNSTKMAEIDKNFTGDTSDDVMPDSVEPDSTVTEERETENQLATINKTTVNEASGEKTTIDVLKESKSQVVKVWAVQLGSFKAKPNAFKLRDELRANGFPSYVESVTTRSGPIYRVRVGPEIKRDNAEKLKKKLAKVSDLDSMIVSH